MARNRWWKWAGAALGAGWLLKERGGRFDGKAVWITGSSRGLGLIMAREFARRGARLVICARDPEELDRARRELEERFGAEVLARRCDVSDRDQVEELAQEAALRFGGIDVLVNNASILQVGPLLDMSERDFQEALEANLWSTIRCTRAVLPQMRRRGGGRIVNITSIGGVVAVPHLLPYCTGKFGAVGFSTGLAAELAREGIRVTTVVPGLMRTGSFLNAVIKGQREKEVQWFSLGASLPFVALDADRAGRQVVDACARGQRWLTLGLPAKALRLGAVLAPGSMVAVQGLVQRMLPEPIEAPGQKAEPAWMHRRGAARSFAVRLGDRAAERNNEVPPGRH